MSVARTVPAFDRHRNNPTFTMEETKGDVAATPAPILTHENASEDQGNLLHNLASQYSETIANFVTLVLATLQGLSVYQLILEDHPLTPEQTEAIKNFHHYKNMKVDDIEDEALAFECWQARMCQRCLDLLPSETIRFHGLETNHRLLAEHHQSRRFSPRKCFIFGGALRGHEINDLDLCVDGEDLSYLTGQIQEVSSMFGIAVRRTYRSLYANKHIIAGEKVHVRSGGQTLILDLSLVDDCTGFLNSQNSGFGIDHMYLSPCPGAVMSVGRGLDVDQMKTYAQAKKLVPISGIPGATFMSYQRRRRYGYTLEFCDYIATLSVAIDLGRHVTIAFIESLVAHLKTLVVPDPKLEEMNRRFEDASRDDLSTTLLASWREFYAPDAKMATEYRKVQAFATKNLEPLTRLFARMYLLDEAEGLSLLQVLLPFVASEQQFWLRAGKRILMINTHQPTKPLKKVLVHLDKSHYDELLTTALKKHSAFSIQLVHAILSEFAGSEVKFVPDHLTQCHTIEDCAYVWTRLREPIEATNEMVIKAVDEEHLTLASFLVDECAIPVPTIDELLYETDADPSELKFSSMAWLVKHHQFSEPEAYKILCPGFDRKEFFSRLTDEQRNTNNLHLFFSLESQHTR